MTAPREPNAKQVSLAWSEVRQPTRIPYAEHPEWLGFTIDTFEPGTEPPHLLVFEGGYWMADRGTDAPGGRYSLELERSDWQADGFLGLDALVCYLAAYQMWERGEPVDLLLPFADDII